MVLSYHFGLIVPTFLFSGRWSCRTDLCSLDQITDGIYVRRRWNWSFLTHWSLLEIAKRGTWVQTSTCKKNGKSVQLCTDQSRKSVSRLASRLANGPVDYRDRPNSLLAWSSRLINWTSWLMRLAWYFRVGFWMRFWSEFRSVGFFFFVDSLAI